MQRARAIGATLEAPIAALCRLAKSLSHSEQMEMVDRGSKTLQREFHCARLRAASLHLIPKLPLPQTTTPERVDLPAIRNAIAVVRHLLQLFRLELQDPNARRKLRRLSQRLLTLSHVLDHIAQE